MKEAGRFSIIPDQIERGFDPKMPAMEHFGTKQNQKIFSKNVTKMEWLEILDFSRLFLLINSGKALGSLPDTTTLSRSARLRFSLPIRMGLLVQRFENIANKYLEKNAEKRLRTSCKVFH